MKKILGVLLGVGLGVGIFWQVKSRIVQKPPTQKILGAPETLSQSLDVGDYKAAIYKVTDASNLILIPNFEEKLSAREAKEKYDCQTLVNGGFYSESNKPIGLFITNNQSLAGYQTNQSFNGVLSINDFATPRITRQVPRDNLVHAVQAGPLLIENGSILKVVSNDEAARRLVVAVTGANELYFVMFYDPDSNFSGPTLGELPGVLKQVQNGTEIHFADAINLDGGTASAMYTPGVSLSEASPVGSFFCAK